MFASIRGTRIYFDVDGAGLVPDEAKMEPRPAVFLLHGGPGGDHVSFKNSCGTLTYIAQLIYVDHRGSGRSQEVDLSTCTLENNIDDLDALRDHLGLDQIVILGSSYGGMVAQGYAVRYPDRVSKLILVATSPSHRFMDEAKRILEERGTAEHKRVCQWLWDGNFDSLDQLQEYYRVMGPMYSTTFNEHSFSAKWHRTIRNYRQLNLGFTTFLREFDYIDDLLKVTAPTLVLAGAHDWICPVSQSEMIAKQIPNSELIVFPNSAHSIGDDEPDDFLAALRRFLVGS